LDRETEPDIRHSALRVLQEYKTPEAVKTVLQLLEDPTPEMRSRAALAAQMLKATQAVPRLILLLKDETARTKAAEALGKLRAHQAMPQLIRLLDAEEQDASDAATKTLAAMQTANVIARLSRWVASKKTEKRIKAAQVIALIRSPESVSCLPPLLEDTDIRVKRAAVRGLTSADPLPLQSLTPLLEDRDPVVRLDVAGAVAKIDPQAAASSLITVLKKPDSPDLTWRYKAVEALTKIPVGVLVERLVRSSTTAMILCDCSRQRFSAWPEPSARFPISFACSNGRTTVSAGEERHSRWA
jgi:HEAT repeat protein